MTPPIAYSSQAAHFRANHATVPAQPVPKTVNWTARLAVAYRPIADIHDSQLPSSPIANLEVQLASSDLTLEPLQILTFYGYRFKIELGFRQAVHVMGAYAYHFWMADMKPIRRGTGDQYLHRTSDDYRAGVRRKLRAYHAHVQLGAIAQGLLQHLAINHTAEVWRGFWSWLRTMNPDMPPSELLVANALRTGLPALFAVCDLIPGLKKMVESYRRYDGPLEGLRMAA